MLAIRLGGYALDACGEDSDLGPGRGPTAHDTCLWLRKLEGLVDGSRELLLTQLVSDRDVDAATLRQLRDLLNERIAAKKGKR